MPIGGMVGWSLFLETARRQLKSYRKVLWDFKRKLVYVPANPNVDTRDWTEEITIICKICYYCQQAQVGGSKL
jgi:hypothetical protein